MARKVRLEFEGAVYHVMCRGDRREDIFRSDQDRWLFLDTLAEACGRSGMRVHAYVLMSNHYHLLLETPEGNLVDGMRWLQGTYTARFNARNRECGHLFQGRYKAIPVEAESSAYFQAASDYILLNPARARLLDKDQPRLGGYRWSSYRAFVGGCELPAWLCRTRVFAAHDLPDEGAGSRRRYAAYLSRRVSEIYDRKETEEQIEAWRRLRRGWYVGGEAFGERMAQAVGAAVRGSRRESFVGDEALRRHDAAAAEQLLARATLAMASPSWVSLAQNDVRKQAVAWLLRTKTTVGGRWIAAALAMGHESNVSRACAAMRESSDGIRARLMTTLMHICKD